MEYLDLNGLRCRLSFEPAAFSIASKHVLVIAKWNGKWLLTKHRERGLEFPGGKVENGETLLEAAKREAFEETGAHLEGLQWFAEYIVESEPPFCKTVFIAKVAALEIIDWMETEGAELVDRLAPDSSYSFLMKDDGMKEIMERVNLYGKWND